MNVGPPGRAFNRRAAIRQAVIGAIPARRPRDAEGRAFLYY
jgi:hypothetical protein